MSDDRPELAEQRDVATVYQPAEDSALLARTLLPFVEPEDRVLDVGTGSGFVARTIRDETGATVVGSDVNPDACRQAAEAGVPVVRGNLLDPFRENSFDIVCFNPPYLPTPQEMEWGDRMEDALSGGEDGRAVIEPFLADVGRLLTADGEVFLLISTLTGSKEVREMSGEAGFVVEQVAEQSEPFEQLLVFRLSTRA